MIQLNKTYLRTKFTDNYTPNGYNSPLETIVQLSRKIQCRVHNLADIDLLYLQVTVSCYETAFHACDRRDRLA